MARKGSFRFFGGEYLRPKKSVEDKGEETRKPPDNQKTVKERTWWMPFGWVVAVAIGAVALYGFSISSRQRKRSEELQEEVTILRSCVKECFSSPPHIETALSLLKEMSERKDGLGEWAKRIRMRVGEAEAYKMSLFGALVSEMKGSEIKCALSGRITRLTEERMRTLSPKRIRDILGEERMRRVVGEFLSTMSDVGVVHLLGGRRDSVARICVEKMTEERFERLFGDRIVVVFRRRLDGLADNPAALEALLGEELIQKISKTYFESLPPGEMVPLVEDDFASLSAAVKEWRRKRSVKVTLKNGDIYEGVLLDKTEEALLLRTEKGKVTIPIDEVEEMEKLFKDEE